MERISTRNYGKTRFYSITLTFGFLAFRKSTTNSSPSRTKRYLFFTIFPGSITPGKFTPVGVFLFLGLLGIFFPPFLITFIICFLPGHGIFNHFNRTLKASGRPRASVLLPLSALPAQDVRAKPFLFPLLPSKAALCLFQLPIFGRAFQ